MTAEDKFISVQIGPISFNGEGVVQVLDHIQSLVGVNVLMVGTSGYATPENVEQSTLASFRGGAKGLMISRVYHEMKLENLAAVGRALDQLGIK